MKRKSLMRQARDKYESEQILNMVEHLKNRGVKYSEVAKQHGLHEHFFTVEFMEHSENFSFISFLEEPTETWKREKENYLLSLFGRSAKAIFYHSSN